MRVRHFPGLVLASLCCAIVAAQDVSRPSSRVWDGRTAEYEAFLRTAPFVRIDAVPVGVTKPRRGFFAQGALAESAAWKVLPPGRTHGYWESYRSEIAAYELDKLVGLGMVPPAVEKQWKGDTGAAVLWMPGLRTWKEIEGLPRPSTWDLQVIRMKMFDNLIGNHDRNQGNLLVDDAWNLYLIDHSRAFISDTRLPATHQRIDRILWDKFLALDEPALSPVRKWVGGGPVRAVLKRRDKMKTVIAELVRKSTESAVFIR